ncbi:hypothetical protein ACHAQH_009918 [Verticillium albo-atrum]
MNQQQTTDDDQLMELEIRIILDEPPIEVNNGGFLASPMDAAGLSTPTDTQFRSDSSDNDQYRRAAQRQWSVQGVGMPNYSFLDPDRNDFLGNMADAESFTHIFFPGAFSHALNMFENATAGPEGNMDKGHIDFVQALADPSGAPDAASLLQARNAFIECASSDKVRAQFAPAIAATLISIIQSMETVQFKLRTAGLHKPDTKSTDEFELQGPATKLSSHFWPDLKKELSILPTKEGWVNTDLECPVCRENMAFVGHYTEDGELTESAANALDVLHCRGIEVASVLPCGHIIGRECLDQIVNNHPFQACPICKGKVLYECGMSLEIVPAPMDHVHLDRFPATVPEGARAPCHCDVCEFYFWRKRWAAELLTVMAMLCPDLLMPLMMASRFITASGTDRGQVVSGDVIKLMALDPEVARKAAFGLLEALMAKGENVVQYLGEKGTVRSWLRNEMWEKTN